MQSKSLFGVKLKSLMDEKKLNSIQMAEKIDKTSSSIRHWCNGVSFPRYAEIIRLSDFFNVMIIDFFPNPKENRKKIVIEELKNNLNHYIDHIPNIDVPPTLKKVLFNHGYPSTNKIVMENSMQNAEHIYIDKLMLSKEYQEQELKAVVMVNDAMSPYLKHGDVAIYHPSTAYTVKGKYVINSADGLEITSIEKLKKCGSLVLRPENPTYSTETFALSEQDLIEFVGMVVSRVSKN